MSVSLVEVMVAASRRLAPLSGECAGHAVLAAADQLLSNPRLLGAADVLIEDNGTVRLAGGPASDERGCDEGLRGLLDGLLAVAHSGGAGLFRVGQRTATGDLGQLVKELEVALIPANRAAARRSLARLHRETERARDAGRLEEGSDVLPGRVGSRDHAPLPSSRVAVEPPPARAMNVDSPRVSSEAHAASHGSGAELSELELDLLAVTEVRFATGPRLAGAQVSQPASPNVEADFGIDVEVEVDLSPATPDVAMQHTQPLPKVEPRRELHETAPLPPVTTQPRTRSEHETPLEPVLGRRYGGVPTPALEPADIHKTPYLGTLVAPVPYYDPPPRDRGQGETGPMPEVVVTAPETSAPTNWEEDDATTDPAPVVAWSTSDEGAEDASDSVSELAKADGLCDPVTEFAEGEVTQLAEAEVAQVTQLAEGEVAELAEGEAAQFAEDEVAQFAEDEVMDLAEDEITEITEDEISELTEDDVTELAESAPLAPCAALAVQARVSPLSDPKPPRVPRTSDVEALLERFRVAEPEPDPLLMRGLKQLAGITLTPPPVLARSDGPESASTPVPRSEPGAPIRPIPTVRIVGS